MRKFFIIENTELELREESLLDFWLMIPLNRLK